MKAININWDTDGEDINLPKEVVVPANLDVDEVADFLSDVYGFCVFSFSIEE